MEPTLAGVSLNPEKSALSEKISANPFLDKISSNKVDVAKSRAGILQITWVYSGSEFSKL